MDIKLNLKKHCIKTEIKKNYEKTLKECLKKGADNDLEFKLESLKKIMETNDLISLRGKHKELLGGLEIEIVLKIDKNEKYILIDDKKRINLL